MAMGVTLFLGMAGLVRLAVIQVVNKEKAAVAAPDPMPVRIPAVLRQPGEPPATLFDANTAIGVLINIEVVVGGLTLDFTPCLVANLRQHPNFPTILFINLLTGWSVLGWVGAMAWALTDIKSREHYHYHQ